MSVVSVEGCVLRVLKDGEAQSGQTPGTLQQISYDLLFFKGIHGVRTNVKPVGRPQGPADMEIMSAGIQWAVWGTYGPLGLFVHVEEQETTGECSDDDEGGGNPLIPDPDTIPLEPGAGSIPMAGATIPAAGGSL